MKAFSRMDDIKAGHHRYLFPLLLSSRLEGAGSSILFIIPMGSMVMVELIHKEIWVRLVGTSGLFTVDPCHEKES